MYHTTERHCEIDISNLTVTLGDKSHNTSHRMMHVIQIYTRNAGQHHVTQLYTTNIAQVSAIVTGAWLVSAGSGGRASLQTEAGQQSRESTPSHIRLCV